MRTSTWGEKQQQALTSSCKNASALLFAFCLTATQARMQKELKDANNQTVLDWKWVLPANFGCYNIDTNPVVESNQVGYIYSSDVLKYNFHFMPLSTSALLHLY